MIISQDETSSIASQVINGRIRPLGRRVIGIRSTGHDFDLIDGRRQYKADNLYLPDEFGDWSNFIKIIAVGNCRIVTEDDIGKQAYVTKELDPGIRRIGGEVFTINEDLISYLVEE